MSYRRTRQVFISGVSFVYFLAISSAFIQWPGLHFPNSGLFPLINRKGYFSEEGILFMCFTFGILLSLSLTLKILSNNLFLLLPACYWYIISCSKRTGAPFFMYQWDALLIETGVVVSLFGVQFEENEEISYSALYAIRFLAFKLMYSSGVVKIIYGDSTWIQLKALNYHFVSQCLPTPLAWYAHQLPTKLLKLGTAMSLWIEIPIAVFILSPVSAPRFIAATMTTILMVMIALTGNYNFFNLLTIVLMIPLVNHDEKRPDRVSTVLTILSLFWLVYYTMGMFSIDNELDISLKMTPKSLSMEIDRYLPLLLLYSIFIVFVGLIKDLTYSWFKDNIRYFHVRLGIGLLSLWFVIIGSVPMTFGLLSSRSTAMKITPNFAIQLYSDYGGYEISSSYGLFRSMTGVGKNFQVSVPTLSLHAKLNEVPEREELIKFRSYSQLTWVSPHQPRLDWQMWFAALSPEQAKIWLSILCERLLLGEDTVFHLLDDSNFKFKGKIESIQIKYREVDFTNSSSKEIWRNVKDEKIIFEIHKNHVNLKKRSLGLQYAYLKYWVEYGQFFPLTTLIGMCTIRFR